MDRHPDQYRYLMRERMADQHSYAERRNLLRLAATRPPLRERLARSLARALFRAAFAVDSSEVWAGLWEKLSPSEPIREVRRAR